MSLSGIFKFFTGFFLGITLLAGSGIAAGYYFFTKLAANPPKPIFAEEQKASPVAKPVSASTASNPQANSQPPASPSPVAKPLPPGAYKARVTWSDGLILRDSPSQGSNRIGGVAFNQEIIVLKESGDKRWQQIRVADGEQEGWIKAGNIERMN